jgi:hypothetical protein
MGNLAMWVLLLLGLLPLAVLPTMLGGGPQDGDATDDDDGPSGFGPPDDVLAGGYWPDDTALGDDAGTVGVPPDDGVPGDGTDDVGPAPDEDATGEAGDAPPFPPTTFTLVPGDAPATFSGFVPGTDRIEVHVDPDGPPAEVTSGQEGGGSWVRVTQGDAVAHAAFPDLADPPTADIHLVTEPLDPDVSDDMAGGGSDGDDAPLAPVTDDTDPPGAPADDDGPVLAPAVPPDGAP